MAKLKKYTKKNGETAWMFQIYMGKDPGTGKKKYTTKRGFKTKREANIAYSRLKVEIEENGSIHKTKAYTFEELYSLWLDSYKLDVKPSTLFYTEREFRLHILPAFGERFITSITPLEAQDQANKWGHHYANARKLVGYTRSVLQFGKVLGALQSNPFDDIKMPPRREANKGKDMFYEHDELEKFIAALNQWGHDQAIPLFRLLAFTGIRKGEALALTWKDIDLDDKQIYISKTVTRKKEGLTIQTPKTRKSKRHVSIDSKTVKALQNWKEKTYTDESSLVFQNSKGSILTPSAPRKWLITVAEKAGLKPIPVHGFRHTHASLLFESGATVKDVQTRLGHADIQTTMNVYTHVTKQSRDNFAEQFSNYLDF